MYTQNVSQLPYDQILKRKFQTQILVDLSTGKYSIRQLSCICGIQNRDINACIEKHDQKDLMNTRIML